MYVYVPDRVATNPPILTLIHYCGGTASAVFGQAQGGGIVSAADQYGFIIVVPSSGRCWDVQSNKTWTRDGGGDSHAIRQMVKYAIDNHNGEPGSRLCDGRLVGRHDDGAPARALSRCLQGRRCVRGHAGRVPRHERIRQRRRATAARARAAR